MTKLQEPIKEHIHSYLVQKINDLDIRIKVHYLISSKDRNELVDKLKVNHPQEPTMKEISDLLHEIMIEINQCTQPYKRY